MHDIRVHVVDYGRKNLYMRFVDPATGKQITKSTGTRNKREAERTAAKWESDLQEGRYKPPSKITWDEFWERYEQEVMAGMADNTARKVWTVRGAAEDVCRPSHLSEISAEWLSRLQMGLRARDCTEPTIEGYIAHLSAAFRWAVEMKMMPEVPKLRRQRRVVKSQGKGRAITTEEFERILEATSKVVGDAVAGSWRHYLEGLWWSGLRLEESLSLYWDRDDRLCVDLNGKRPMLLIPGELEKGKRDRMLPIAPEFAAFLERTPVEERTGRVLRPAKRKGRGISPSVLRVCRTVSEIGEKANVKVWTHPKTGKVKFASAHDLRRSFGFRWSSRVMPAVLQQLMRHENITTTMQFYVGRNAVETADAIWTAFEGTQGNTSGNTDPKTSDISRDSTI